MKKIIASLSLLLLVGCNSSTTYSYVCIGDAALKSMPAEVKAGLKAEMPSAVPAVPSVQGHQDLGSQGGSYGTCIIIGVNSTTSKPVDVSAANGNDVAVGKESALKTTARVAGAAGGTLITGGNPVGAAAGSMLPEAADVVKKVATEAVKSVSP